MITVYENSICSMALIKDEPLFFEEQYHFESKSPNTAACLAT